MSKDTRKFFEQAKQPSMGPGEAAMEGIKAVAPGLSWENIKNDIGSELKHLGQQGAHELAAAIFNGNAFVMYPRQGHDDPQHGLSNEAHQEVEHDRGMSM